MVDIVVAEKPVSEPSLSERMAADLAALQDAPEVEEASEEAEKPATEETETSEAVEASEDSEDDEEADESSTPKKDEEKKPPNRYQKLKARFEGRLKEVEAGATKARSESSEALHIANQWRGEALALKRLLHDAGVQLTPQQAELFAARRTIETQKLTDELSKQAHTKEEEHHKTAAFQRDVQDFQEKGAILAKKFPGLAAREILLGFAAMEEAGAGLTLEQVASNIAAAKGITAKAKSAKAQSDANLSAPKTHKTSHRMPPKGGTDLGSMANFLKATGL